MTNLVFYASFAAFVFALGLCVWFGRGLIRRWFAGKLEARARHRAIKAALREYEAYHRLTEDCVAKCPCRAAQNLLASAELYKDFACRKGSSAASDSVGPRGYIHIAMCELKRAMQQTEVALA
jgi:hypothetical protein